MRTLDDSLRAWAKTPPTNEAHVLFSLGLINEVPDDSSEDPEETVVETLSWQELQQRWRDNPVTEDPDE